MSIIVTRKIDSPEEATLRSLEHVLNIIPTLKPFLDNPKAIVELKSGIASAFALSDSLRAQQQKAIEDINKASKVNAEFAKAHLVLDQRENDIAKQHADNLLALAAKQAEAQLLLAKKKDDQDRIDDQLDAKRRTLTFTEKNLADNREALIQKAGELDNREKSLLATIDRKHEENQKILDAREADLIKREKKLELANKKKKEFLATLKDD